MCACGVCVYMCVRVCCVFVCVSVCVHVHARVAKALLVHKFAHHVYRFIFLLFVHEYKI